VGRTPGPRPTPSSACWGLRYRCSVGQAFLAAVGFQAGVAKVEKSSQRAAGNKNVVCKLGRSLRLHVKRRLPK